MKKIKALLFKHADKIAAFALVIGTLTLHDACYVIYHQPKVPEGLNAYRR